MLSLSQFACEISLLLDISCLMGTERTILKASLQIPTLEFIFYCLSYFDDDDQRLIFNLFKAYPSLHFITVHDLYHMLKHIAWLFLNWTLGPAYPFFGVWQLPQFSIPMKAIPSRGFYNLYRRVLYVWGVQKKI